MSRLPVSIIVAVARNGVIGSGGDMPWRLSTDLKRFKQLTLRKPVIMGRKTYESIGRPLPERCSIVVTRDPHWQADGVRVAATLEEAFAIAENWARDNGAGEICVIGGGEIYRQALGKADRLHVTHVLAEPEGDTLFPQIDPAVWAMTGTTDVPAGPKDSFETRYVEYERKRS